MQFGNVISINTGYEPRPLQREIHKHIRRFSVLAIHRRFGKTVLAVNECIDKALECGLRNPRIGYIAPYYKQAKSIAWDYLKDFTASIPQSRAYESELRVDIQRAGGDKARIQLFGADHPDSLRGLYFDFVVFDEFGLQPIAIWTEVVRPALADRKGSAMFVGTPAGKNHFYDKYQEALQNQAAGHPEWYCATYRADETNVIDPEELESAREGMPESEYRQEFLCDWAAAVKGSYYAAEMGRARDAGRICRVPHEPGLPVYCAFDLGLDDAMAVWFCQFFNNEIRLLEYDQWTDTGLLDVLKEIRQRPYVYAEMIMPWDINKRQMMTAKTRLETVEDMGFDVIPVQKQRLEDGINAVRMILDKCWFDEQKCAQGIDCLENYRKKVDRMTGLFLESPLHDEFSDGADAFRYLAQAYQEEFASARVSHHRQFRRQTHDVVRSV